LKGPAAAGAGACATRMRGVSAAAASPAVVARRLRRVTKCMELLLVCCSTGPRSTAAINPAGVELILLRASNELHRFSIEPRRCSQIRSNYRIFSARPAAPRIKLSGTPRALSQLPIGRGLGRFAAPSKAWSITAGYRAAPDIVQWHQRV